MIAEPLFRVKYVEKAGTGTTDMIDDCRKAGLPEPDFEQRGPHFVVTLWRDWLTDEVLSGLGLNERQMKAVEYIKSHGRITNANYQRVAGCPQRTATRDLNKLVQNGVVTLEGKGRGAQYRLLRKRAIRKYMNTFFSFAEIRHKCASHSQRIHQKTPQERAR